VAERQEKEYMMRKIVALSAVLFIGLGWTALPALAQTQGQYTPQTQGQYTPQTQGQYTPPAQGQYTPPGTSTQQQPGAMQQQPGASQQQNPSSGMNRIASRYAAQVTGEVTNVDHQSGKITLRTVDGEVNATFPPAAVQNVRQGDRVSLAIALTTASSPSASPNSPSASPRTQ